MSRTDAASTAVGRYDMLSAATRLCKEAGKERSEGLCKQQACKCWCMAMHAGMCSARRGHAPQYACKEALGIIAGRAPAAARCFRPSLHSMKRKNYRSELKLVNIVRFTMT